MKNNALSAKLKRIIVLAVILVVAIALAILTIQIIKQLKSQNESKTEGSQDQSTLGKPVEIPAFELGEICEETSVDGSYHSIVFNSVYLTDEIKGQTGRYLVFTGDINSSDCSVEYQNFSIDLTRAGHMLHKYYDYFFESELSEALSEANLPDDGESGAMNGEFCFVFSIDDASYDLIKDGIGNPPTVDNENFNFGEISLRAGIHRYYGTVFRFSTTDVQYIESIN